MSVSVTSDFVVISDVLNQLFEAGELSESRLERRGAL